MANIPGIPPNALPGVYSNVTTSSTGVGTTTGIRISCILGDSGYRSEVLVSSALGGGADGFNPTYTSTNGSDGRHFSLSFAPVISNRTTLFKNGIPLVGLEEQIDSNPFSDLYDYRLDIVTGHIELQAAHLVDLGGATYRAGATNVGQGALYNDGYASPGPLLVDLNAPSETWTIKCISVQRNSLNQIIPATAKFIAFGSVSGNILDANGNIITWTANGTNYSNGILTFSIDETTVAFREGDFFIIEVAGGALVKNDSLSGTYIAVADINDPVFFTTMKSLAAKYGPVSLSNTISLGSQLAFDNGAPGVLAMQAAPALPRRTSFELVTDFDASSTDVNDYVIPFPLGVVPDINNNIHIFVTNTSTGVETQLLANKFPFYTLNTSGNPSTSSFVFSDINPPAGWDFSYTVITGFETLSFAQDGYMNAIYDQSSGTDKGLFSSPSVLFTEDDIGKLITVVDGYNKANIGSFGIIDVAGGIATIESGTGAPTTTFAPFTVDAGALRWHLFNPGTGLVVAGGVNGAISAPSSTGSPVVVSATFTDATFNSFNSTDTNYLLVIDTSTVSSTTNIGTFQVTASPTSSTLTIRKSFVTETGIKFELQDPTVSTGEYLVLNHNIVPSGNDLRVTIVDQRDATFFDAGWLTALETLEAFELDILVPIPIQTPSAIFQNCLSHCITMSNTLNRKERVLFIGAINGLTPDNLTGATQAAVENIGVLEGIQGNTVAEILAGNTEDLTNYSVPDSFGTTFRCVYFFPDQIVVQVGGDNVIVDGFYLAPAAAGLCSATSNIAIPLTNKVLSGFSILNSRQYSNTVLSALASAGVTTVQPVAGGGRVVWGITTTQSGFPEEQEISVVFIRDRIAKTMRAGFAGFIGLPEDQNTIPMLTARANSLLKSFISQKLITDYANLSVARDDVDPRQYNVGAFVQPAYGINWIYISVGVGTLPTT